MSMPKMAKGTDMSDMLTNGGMFSTFKRTDSHTVRGRPTRKDGVVIYSGGPMIDYNRKLIEKFKRRDNRLCFFHYRLSRKK